MRYLHYLIKKKYFFLFYLFFLSSSVVGATTVSTPEVDIRLMPHRTALDGQKKITIGVLFDLKDDWKIYWRSPGDAGFPPSLRWKESHNIDSVLWHWPAPVRFTQAGLDTIGYEEEVIFPLEVNVTDPSRTLSARFAIDYLICSDICRPGHATLATEIPPGHGQVADTASRIEHFLQRVPQKMSPFQVTRANLHTGAENDLSALYLTIENTENTTFPIPTDNFDIFIEGPSADNSYGLLSTGPPALMSREQDVATLRVPLLSSIPPNTAVTITLAAGSQSLETTLIPNQKYAPPPVGTLLVMLGIAFLGGLILNAMPCVLPVLSLKILHLIQNAHLSQNEIRHSFFGTACGIVLAFIGLGSVLALLKAGGQTFGWGFQFQQPIFLSVLTLILVLFAANLQGIFSFTSFSMPEWLVEARGPTWIRPLVNGVFITALATPCSAPLVGTAIGFAFVQEPFVILSILLVMGLGMAVPYFAVAALPRFGQFLPRPGPWMIHFRSLLSLFLLGAACWLLWVISAQNHLVAVGTFIISAIALGILQTKSGKKAKVLFTFATGAALACTALIPLMLSKSPLEKPWVPFQKTAIQDLVTRGQTVFIDVTARWCLTCQVNKLAVLTQKPVSEKLRAPDIVAMQADWTMPSSDISSYLARFQRYGIPFNVVYGPSCPTGIVLPELLSIEDTMTALHNASSPSGTCSL